MNTNVLQEFHLYITPQLLKSLAIVIYIFETEMRDAVSINY